MRVLVFSVLLSGLIAGSAFAAGESPPKAESATVKLSAQTIKDLPPAQKSGTTRQAFENAKRDKFN